MSFLKKFMQLSCVIWGLIFVITSCESNEPRNVKSNKQLLSPNADTLKEFLDSNKNLYSSYRFNISSDVPDNWSTDFGVSEHTIFRALQRDSGITWVLNVIVSDDNITNPNLAPVKFYYANKTENDKEVKKLLEKKFNLKLSRFETSLSHISNYESLKTVYEYQVKEPDIEYYQTTVQHQVAVGYFRYTITLHVPTIFYEAKPLYYDRLFLDVNFI